MVFTFFNGWEKKKKKKKSKEEYFMTHENHIKSKFQHLQKMFRRAQSCLFVYILSVTGLELQGQS